MEIPRSLQSTWKEVIKDNKITRQEFQKLKDAAAPNKKDEELDKAEINFLGKLVSSIGDKSSISVPSQFKSQNTVKKPDTTTNKNTNVKSRTTSTQPISSSNQSNKDISFESIGNAGNAKSTWAQQHPGKPFPRNQIFYVTKDGNLISQTKVNETAKKDPNYFNTLGLKSSTALFIPNLRHQDANNFKLENNKIVSKNNTQVNQPAKTNNISFVDESETKNNFNPGTIPESLKSEWQKISSDGKINYDDFNNLVKAAAPSGNDADLTPEKLSFLNNLRKEFDKGLKEVKVDKPSDNTTKTESTNTSTTTVNDITATPQQNTTNKTSNDTTSANQQSNVTTKSDNDSTTATTETNKESSQESDIAPTAQPDNKPVTNNEQPVSSLSNIGKVPDSVKSLWDDLSKDKEISPDDLEKLIKAAKPTGKNSEIEPEELTFITNLIQKMIDGNGTAK